MSRDYCSFLILSGCPTKSNPWKIARCQPPAYRIQSRRFSEANRHNVAFSSCSAETDRVARMQTEQKDNRTYYRIAISYLLGTWIMMLIHSSLLKSDYLHQNFPPRRDTDPGLLTTKTPFPPWSLRRVSVWSNHSRTAPHSLDIEPRLPVGILQMVRWML